MSLKQAIREALKGNDVEVHAKLTALRIECRERGIDSDKVTKLIQGVIHEPKQSNESIVSSEQRNEHGAALPPAQEPIRHEANKEECKPGSLQGEELSRRAPQSSEPIPDGMTPSGTRKSGAAGGRSIFDFIDEKK